MGNQIKELDIIESKYFAELLVDGDLSRLGDFCEMFNFTDAEVKRKAFNSKRKQLMIEVFERRGNKCLLQYPNICHGAAAVLDHFIPLSTNKINKDIKKMKSESGKKVPSKSYGSNHPKNLIPACPACNAYKKHRLPTKNQAKQIMLGSL